MAYVTTNPPRLQTSSPLTGAGQTWTYSSADSFATVAVALYFTNAADLAMKVNDLVEVIDTATPMISWGRVTAVAAAGATIAAEISPTGDGVAEAFTALTTVGAGTITAAGIAGGATNRTGSTVAYTDTTATAALIIAAIPGAYIGQSWEYTYYNNTLGLATITGGTGVTVSGGGVPANMWARYLVTYTAAATLTMVPVMMGQIGRAHV